MGCKMDALRCPVRSFRGSAAFSLERHPSRILTKFSIFPCYVEPDFLQYLGERSEMSSQ